MPSNRSNITTRRKFLLGLLITLAVFSVAEWLWTQPNGVGEYRKSPDGRWTAHVSSLSRGTFWGERRSYLEILLVDSSNQKAVIRREIPYSDTDRAPDYGDRSQTFINWATNSSQFTFEITNGASLVIAAPK